jgi:hypothetical protein
VRVSPKRERDRHRIDLDPGPPCSLITVPVELAMMEASAASDRQGRPTSLGVYLNPPEIGRQLSLMRPSSLFRLFGPFN